MRLTASSNSTPINDCSRLERNANSIWKVIIVPPAGRPALGATGSKVQWLLRYRNGPSIQVTSIRRGACSVTRDV